LYQEHLQSWKKNILPNIRNKYLKNPNLFIENKNERKYIYDHHKELNFFFIKPLKYRFKEKKFCSSLLKNRMINEIYYETVPVLTHSEDLNFMQYSVENRSPYLYPSCVTDSFKIKRKYLMKKGFTKYILREISKGLLPDKIRLDMRKKGFNASFHTLVNVHSKEFIKFIKKKSKLDKIIYKNKILNEIKNKNNENYISKFLFSYVSVKIFLELNK